MNEIGHAMKCARGVQLDGDPQTPKALNQLAREQMIVKLLNDIRMDLTICEVEGWSAREYIMRLYDEVNYFRLQFIELDKQKEVKHE